MKKIILSVLAIGLSAAASFTFVACADEDETANNNHTVNKSLSQYE